MKSETSTLDRDEILRKPNPVLRGLHEAHIDAIDLHIRFEAPMVFWEDGKVVHYGPERLPALKAESLEAYRKKYGVEYTVKPGSDLLLL